MGEFNERIISLRSVFVVELAKPITSAMVVVMSRRYGSFWAAYFKPLNFSGDLFESSGS